MSKLRVRGSLDFDLHPYSDTWAPAVRALHVASFTVLARDLHDDEQMAGHAALIGARDYAADLARSYIMLALEGDGRLAATAGWLEAGDGTARIRKVFVRPDLARRGRASAMLGMAERAAIAAGRTFLTVRANLNAVPLYAKAGYARLSEGMMPTPTGAELPVVYMERSAA